MIVADCTVIVRLIVAFDDPSAAETLRVREPDWCAPALWEAEFASALRKYERAGFLTPDGCDDRIKRALELFAQTTHHVSLARVMETARRTGCSTYDSHYLALAEDLNLKLYTYDREILAQCPRLARKP